MKTSSQFFKHLIFIQIKTKILTAFVLLSLALVSTAQKTLPATQKKVTIAPKKTYTIGLNPALGGYVLQLSADKMHGLVAETKNQGTWSWYAAIEIQKLSCVHTPDGAKFSNWRLPTKEELNLMYTLRNAIGMGTSMYWSSSLSDNNEAWMQYFYKGNQYSNHKNDATIYVRAVRDF